MFTIEELHKRTGLPVHFIRNCVKSFKDVLEPHIKRGEYNSLLFDNNALIIFDKVKQLKEQGLSLKEIQKQLNEISNTKETPLKHSQTGTDRDLKDEIIELHQQNAKDRENHFQEKLAYEHQLAELKQEKSLLEREKLVLENSLKLLPEGKPPEVIKSDWEKSQSRHLEISNLLSRLEELEGKSFKGKERRQLLRRLRELQGG